MVRFLRHVLYDARGASVKILSLTHVEEPHLCSLGITVARDRLGGSEHDYWKWAITNQLRRQGYDVEPIGGRKTVDVRATRGRETLWVEVETGRSDILANAKKCAML